MLGGAVLVGLVIWGGYELLGADTQTTDDAYVAGNVVPITAREAGTVIAINADNTQGVKAGDTLIELDPALVDAQMDAAEAALARAVRQVHADYAMLHASGGEVAEAQAALASARGDYERRKAATDSGAVPKEDLAHASDQLRHAQAALDANFRETQLADLRIGQPGTVTADSWGSSVTYHGRLDGLSAGSGSAFALLPPQNASGNWIKVVQRLPVRIALDPRELDDHPLRIGLSVSVSIDTSDHASAPIAAPSARVVAQLPAPAGPSAIDRRIAEIIAANGGER